MNHDKNPCFPAKIAIYNEELDLFIATPTAPFSVPFPEIPVVCSGVSVGDTVHCLEFPKLIDDEIRPQIQPIHRQIDFYFRPLSFAYVDADYVDVWINTLGFHWRQRKRERMAMAKKGLVSLRKEDEKPRKMERRLAWDVAHPDALLLIFTHLPSVVLARCSTVCMAWHSLIKKSPWLWEMAFEEQLKEVKLRVQKPAHVEAAEMDFKTKGIVGWQRTHLVQGTMTANCWKAHTARVNSCRMSSESIVSGSSDQTIRVWSLLSQRCVEEYKVPAVKSPVVDLEFDAHKIIGAAGTDIWVWNRNRGGSVTHKMGGHGHRLYSICLTDPEVAGGCADGCVRLYDLYSGRCSRIFRSHSAAVTSVSIEDSVQLLASGSRDGSVHVCDSSTGDIVACLLRPNPMREVQCLQWDTNSYLLFAGTSVGRLCCWDMRKQAILWQEGVDNSVMASLHLQEYAPRTLVTGSMDGRVRVWSTSGKMLKSFPPMDTDINSSTRATPLLSVLKQGRQAREQPILCVRVGATRVLTAHTDGTLAMCRFRI